MRRQQEDGFQILTSSRGRHIRYPCSDVPVFEQMRTGFHVTFFLVPRDGKIEKIPSSSCSTSAEQKRVGNIGVKIGTTVSWTYFNLGKIKFPISFERLFERISDKIKTFLFHRFVKLHPQNFKRSCVRNSSFENIEKSNCL